MDIVNRSKLGVSIIIPTWCEADNIKILIPELIATFKDYEFSVQWELIVVDDNSPDGTANIARNYAKHGYPIRVIERPCRMGYISALVDGIRKSSYNIVVFMDADLQHRPNDVIKIINPFIKGYEVLISIGSRYVSGGRNESNVLRRLISRLAIIVAKIFIPEIRFLKDPTSALIASKKDFLLACLPYMKGHMKILIEILSRKRIDRKKIVEVPVIFRPRKKGTSKNLFRLIISFVIMLFDLSRLFRFLIICVILINLIIMCIFFLSYTNVL